MNPTPLCEITTSLPVLVLCRPSQSQGRIVAPSVDWREFDHGPGIIHLPQGEDAIVRIKNIDDDLLRQLVAEISGCDAIAGLNLSENRGITDAGLAHLVRLPQLSYLSLSSCSLTNHGLIYLLELTSLEYLDLSYCNRITNDGLVKLRSLRRLKYLDLQGCVKVNNGSLSKLRRADLTIHHRITS